MPLIKTLSQTLKQDKEKFKVPKSVQQAIPIRKIWPDGIFQVESKYSRTFRFTDINYSIASKADKTEMFLDYSELLNALDSGCTAKITLNNRKINKEEFEQSLLIPMKGDGLDEYRKEYNDMLLSKISGTNNSIYEGTTQLQTVAAIRYVTNGSYIATLRNYEAIPCSEDMQPLMDRVKEMANKFDACTNAVKEAQNQELLDFVARRLYEMLHPVWLS